MWPRGGANRSLHGRLRLNTAFPKHFKTLRFRGCGQDFRTTASAYVADEVIGWSRYDPLARSQGGPEQPEQANVDLETR